MTSEFRDARFVVLNKGSAPRLRKSAGSEQRWVCYGSIGHRLESGRQFGYLLLEVKRDRLILRVSAAGIDEPKKALPKCKIQWDGGVIEPEWAPST